MAGDFRARCRCVVFALLSLKGETSSERTELLSYQKKTIEGITYLGVPCVAGGIVFAPVVLAAKPPLISKRLLPILRAASSPLPSQNFACANDPAGYAG